MAVSAQVVWDVIRFNDAFVVKSNGIALSKDPKNLANVHSYKYSGLAQPKALGIAASTTKADNKKKVTITLTQTGTEVNKPKSASAKKTISGARKAGIAAVNAAINSAYYRPDLRAAALARYSKLVRANGVQANATAPAGRKARARRA